MLSYPTRISNEVSLSLNKAHPGVLARGRHFFPWCGWESLVNFPHMFQVHSELAAVPEQHDGCGLYDGSGCRVSAGHRRASRPPLSISCSVPGKPEGNIGNCTTLQAEIKKKRGKKSHTWKTGSMLWVCISAVPLVAARARFQSGVRKHVYKDLVGAHSFHQEGWEERQAKGKSSLRGGHL